jgi:hypothetical protein
MQSRLSGIGRDPYSVVRPVARGGMGMLTSLLIGGCLLRGSVHLTCLRVVLTVLITGVALSWRSRSTGLKRQSIGLSRWKAGVIPENSRPPGMEPDWM